jgi:hypothetical protein
MQLQDHSLSDWESPKSAYEVVCNLFSMAETLDYYNK